MNKIIKGQSVSFFCTSFLEDGTSLDDKVSEPITMKAGERGTNQISTAVANSLLGMKSNESKQITLPARLAFGEFNPNLIYRLPVQQGKKYQIGQDIQITLSRNNRDEVLEGVVSKLDQDYAFVDTNHPFAGKKLLIKIKVQSVR